MGIKISKKKEGLVYRQAVQKTRQEKQEAFEERQHAKHVKEMKELGWEARSIDAIVEDIQGRFYA